VFYSSYWTIVLCSYFKAKDTVPPEFKVSIAYWPERTRKFHLLTIPYIQLVMDEFKNA